MISVLLDRNNFIKNLLTAKSNDFKNYVAGPEFWGLVNPEWSLCSKGKRQSPINIDPKQLLYDPHLKHVRLDKHRVSTT